MSVEFKLPDIGEGVVEGEIVSWLVKPGDVVEEDQPMVEVMTDKATVEIPSPVAGTIKECRGNAGEIIEVGEVLVVIDADGAEEGVEQPKAPEPKPASQQQKRESKPAKKSKAGQVLATPAVRKRARELDIDISKIEGTGPGGRITGRDIDRYERGERPSPIKETPPEAASRHRPGESIPYRGIRRAIGQRMVLSKQTAPHYTYVEEANVTDLVRLRKQFLELEENEGRRLTYLPFFMKAVVAGLKKFPLLNATLDEEQGEIRLKSEYHLGMAVAAEEGLIVPVVSDVDRKGILQLSDELYQLAERARQGKASLEELKGSTFTITSLGELGGLLATPILNYPEVGILGVHKIKPRAVVQEGQVVIRDMVNLSLSLDHRVVDGAIGAEFMQYIIRFIEEPALLLLDNAK